MNDRYLAEQLGAVHSRTDLALDELLSVIGPRLAGTDDVAAFVGLANELRDGKSDSLAQLLALAVMRLVAADHTKTRLRRRIHRATRGRAALRATTIRSEATA